MRLLCYSLKACALNAATEVPVNLIPLSAPARLVSPELTARTESQITAPRRTLPASPAPPAPTPHAGMEALARVTSTPE